MEDEWKEWKLCIGVGRGWKREGPGRERFREREVKRKGSERLREREREG